MTGHILLDQKSILLAIPFSYVSCQYIKNTILKIKTQEEEYQNNCSSTVIKKKGST